MNERLKQIMLEHGLHKHISEDCQHRMEMLYELIVRECAEVCMKEIDTGFMMAPKSPWMAKQIREHFGVEE